MSRLLRPLRPSALRSSFCPSPASTLVPARLASSFIQNSPSPPRLPPEQQAEFERLQRAAEAALSSHTSIPAASAGEPPADAPLSTSRHVSMPSSDPAQVRAAGAAPPPPSSSSSSSDDSLGADTFSGGIRRGAPPEFEGDKNPKTGEIGGPKNEPLRWGANGDWSFNGRVTDF
ncbi:hypothetical protein VTJ83DRAFT_5806 [Remersonia thermophila]|uniref:Succinate dehydrogenase assembly factor 4, mitochondrial n=1 Tax=Remersonia thermophila TaxID=72144 RepID=A0ABR4D7W8_9PEZI